MLTLADLRNDESFADARTIVEKAGSDSIAVFGGVHEQGYHTQQNPDEFAGLICYLLRRCKPIDRYAEIGVAAAGTTRLIYEMIGFDHAVLIDNGQHPKHGYFESNIAAFRPIVNKIIGDSHGPAVKSLLEETQRGQPLFDVAFIDGDHSYEGVMADIELIRPYCRPTTLLVFHDTQCCEGVKRAFAVQQKLAEFVNESKPLGIGVAYAGTGEVPCLT